jgi:8-oxo-dGTP pyrophosphatase MutT (NUDIX family)
VSRQEFFHDPGAPRAELVAPSVFAAVRDGHGRLLMVCRVDNGMWELPGGQVDVGDAAVGALQREVAEESGIVIDVMGVSGVYTDPGYVIRSVAGRVRQPFTVCFHAVPGSGAMSPRPDQVETSDAAWIDPARLDALPVHPAMRLWIGDALDRRRGHIAVGDVRTEGPAL